MRKLHIVLLAAVALLLAACQGLGGEPVVVATMPPRPTAMAIVAPQTAPDLALGAQIYAQNCTRCHGINGAGDGEFVLSGQITEIVDFTDPAAIAGKTPEEYFRIVTEGRLDTLMPPWADTLTETERWAVANYVMTLANGGQPPVVAVAQGATAVPTGAPTAVATSAVPTGVVTGQVVNGTADAASPAGLALNLHMLNGRTQEAVFEAQSDAAGAYRFENVPLRHDREYVITTEYHDITFTSEILRIDPGAPELNLPVTVYELGADASAITVDGAMMQIGVLEGELQVVQLLRFVNSSDRVYVNRTETEQTSVVVPVPTGAQYADFAGSSYVAAPDNSAVYATAPVMPGEPYMMHLIYTMPYGQGVTLEQALPYTFTGRYEALLDNDGLTLEGGLLTAQGTQQVGGRALPYYVAEMSLPAGEYTRISVSGAPAVIPEAQPAGTTTTLSATPAAVALIVIGVAAIGVAVFLFIRENRTAPAVAPVVPVVTNETQELMKQIAELDVRRRDGKLDEKTYQRQRSALKARLTDVMKRSS